MKAFQNIFVPAGAAIALSLFLNSTQSLAQGDPALQGHISSLEQRVAFLEAELRAAGGSPAVAPARATGGAPAETVSANWHEVARGDTLTAIARRYETTVPVLVDINKLHNESRIVVGQKLLVPTNRVPGRHTPTHVVRVTAAPTAPSAPVQPVSNAPRYVVQEGDTLASISRRFGHSIDSIRHQNGLADADYIRIDQVLIMPGHGQPEVTPAPAPQPPQVAAQPQPRPAATVAAAPQPQKKPAQRRAAPQPPRQVAKEPASSSNFMIYTVRRNDTLDSIAATFHESVDALRTRNGLAASHRLTIGDRLEVPTDGIFVSN